MTPQATDDLKLLRIRAWNFTAGCELLRGSCFQAAPILRHFIGRNEEDIRNYCRRRGWQID